MLSIKSLAMTFLRIFTVYDNINGHESSEPRAHYALMIVERRKRMIGLTIPMLMWHGYQGQYIPASWSICTLYIMQILGGVNASGIQCQIQTLGSVLFSIINAIVTFSAYLLYSIAVWQSTRSLVHAAIQLFLLALPDVVDTATSIRHVYTKINEGVA